MRMVVLQLIRVVMTRLYSDTEGKRGNVEKTKTLSLPRGITVDNASGELDSGGNDSLIRVGVDALLGLLTNEKVGN